MVEHYFDIAIRVAIFFYALWCGGVATTIFNRIPNEIPIGPSHKPRCNKCGNEIKFKYFFPVFGYFLSNGKCVKCGTKIPRIYLLIELSILFYILLLSMRFDIIDEKFISTSLYGAYLITFAFILLSHKQIKIRLTWMLVAFILAYLGYGHRLPQALDLFGSAVMSYGAFVVLKKNVEFELNEFKVGVILMTSFGTMVSFVFAVLALIFYALCKTKLKNKFVKIKSIWVLVALLAFAVVLTFLR